MEKILLSICIPTYNRCLCLKDCLDTILSQEGFGEDVIEIVICDNASVDDTTLVVQKYQEKYTNIFYHKNKENLGFDRNLDNSVVYAHGKYCMILSDDDGLLEGALERVLTILHHNHTSYYLSNSLSFDNTFKEKIALAPNLPFGDTLHQYSTLNYFVKTMYTSPTQIVGYFGAMSGQIFLRKKWTEYDERKQYIGTQIIHLHTLFSVMKNKTFGIIETPVIKARADNLRWDSFGMHTDIARITMALKGFKWIIANFDITHNVLSFYVSFIITSCVNVMVRLIKKYVFRDSQNIYKIRKKIYNLYKKSVSCFLQTKSS